MKNEKERLVLVLSALAIALFFISLSTGAEVVSLNEPTVCCETTQSGLSCQNVPSEECAPGARSVPTSCETTSFCRPGTCVDSADGTCADNTAQLVCNNDGGVWFEESPAQCSLGCCVLGDQAAFVTLTRCKALSADLGLQTNYNSGIKDEAQCILSVAGQEKGACVYDFEFERTCRFTTRADCGSGVNGSVGGEFFQGRLCSAEELGTNCGPTTQTTLVSGKDEVYFVDSCGNQANIYDASKVEDQEYWSNVKTKAESCNPQDSEGNANSKTCGNCNYLLGSFGREAEVAGETARYGDYICADLNCDDTSNGEDYRHGESWCVNSDSSDLDEGKNSVGSRYYRHVCINGEEVVESCADFRQETCIEDEIETSLGTFSQAACRVNRWQDCTVQDNRVDCENTDRRDCIWKPGEFNIALLNGSANGVCIPKNTPGIKFWEGAEAANICAQANAQCTVTFEKGLFGDEECSDNCECLDSGWQKQHADLCSALGDCGPGTNWLGEKGNKLGFEIKQEDVENQEESGGGLFG